MKGRIKYISTIFFPLIIIISLSVLHRFEINSDMIIKNKSNTNDESRNNIYYENHPKISGFSRESFIYIANNWTDTNSTYDWCIYKHGFYIIENLTIDARDYYFGIKIQGSNNPFVIRNSTI